MPFAWKHMQIGVVDAIIEQRALDLPLYTATFHTNTKRGEGTTVLRKQQITTATTNALFW